MWEGSAAGRMAAGNQGGSYSWEGTGIQNFPEIANDNAEVGTKRDGTKRDGTKQTDRENNRTKTTV